MKKHIILSLFALGSFLFLLVGCAPQLAQTKYGGVETQWKTYIQKSYGDWTPPPTPPPINKLSTSSNYSEGFTADVVPEPTSQVNSGIPDITKTQHQSTVTPSQTKTYTVKKGDTLWSISCKFYNNDGTKWKKIQETNKGVLPTPSKLRPGLVLTIPSD